ncbi:DUF2637 domain-containing protein [Sphaerisporangium fuscum]|uniref:DUF2637 domain-containing protein n=1 Tax=Sphaerisporangium fuscum TaxID=2835868 RepID=UPI001BDD39F0|nr:DUF2637 domain-containing protein [Sphaerisporangium fuscum]
MDVTPPLAAAKPSRRSAPLSAPAQPSRAALVLRRVGTAVAGLAVAALAAGACVLSFAPLRTLAEMGGADPRLAYLYPAGFDALLVIALISVLLLRSTRLLLRLQAVVILAVLVAAAAVANVVIARHTLVDPGQAAIGVAVAPWVMLVLGLWLFVLPARRPQPQVAEAAESEERPGHDLVPFGGEERDPEQAPPLEAVVHPHSPERDPAPRLEQPVREPEPEITPVVPPTPAPETPTVDELPPLDADEPSPSAVVEEEEETSAHDDRYDAPVAAADDRDRYDTPVAAADDRDRYDAPEQAVPRQEHEVPEPEPEQRLVPQPRGGAAPAPTPEPAPEQRRPDRPLRWGDLVRPPTGDVLVHPLPKPVAERELGDTQPYPHITDEMAAEEPTAADTQPYPHLRDEAAPLPSEAPADVPDPAHGAGEAEEEESRGHGPYGAEPTAPPSLRVRSTPLPPEDATPSASE